MTTPKKTLPHLRAINYTCLHSLVDELIYFTLSFLHLFPFTIHCKDFRIKSHLGNISRTDFQVPIVNQRFDYDIWLSISDWQVHHAPTTLISFIQTHLRVRKLGLHQRLISQQNYKTTQDRSSSPKSVNQILIPC